MYAPNIYIRTQYLDKSAKESHEEADQKQMVDFQHLIMVDLAHLAEKAEKEQRGVFLSWALSGQNFYF